MNSFDARMCYLSEYDHEVNVQIYLLRNIILWLWGRLCEGTSTIFENHSYYLYVTLAKTNLKYHFWVAQKLRSYWSDIAYKKWRKKDFCPKNVKLAVFLDLKIRMLPYFSYDIVFSLVITEINKIKALTYDSVSLSL